MTAPRAKENAPRKSLKKPAALLALIVVLLTSLALYGVDPNFNLTV